LLATLRETSYIIVKILAGSGTRLCH